MLTRSAEVPREMALLESFEPLSLTEGVLRLRVRSAERGATFAAARSEQVAALAQAASGQRIRVMVDAAEPAARRPAPAPAASGAGDDAARHHPLVRQIADLFDASIGRVEAAGTLPPAEVAPEEPDEPPAGDVHV